MFSIHIIYNCSKLTYYYDVIFIHFPILQTQHIILKERNSHLLSIVTFQSELKKKYVFWKKLKCCLQTHTNYFFKTVILFSILISYATLLNGFCMTAHQKFRPKNWGKEEWNFVFTGALFLNWLTILVLRARIIYMRLHVVFRTCDIPNRKRNILKNIIDHHYCCSLIVAIFE